MAQASESSVVVKMAELTKTQQVINKFSSKRVQDHATSCRKVLFTVNNFLYGMGRQTQLWSGPMREHVA